MLGLSRLKISLMTSAGVGGSFSPASLFASGEPGGWYDPSDLTTLFQDSAGTTPVTAAGQSVGLWLDKSRGLVLGSELRSTGVVGLTGTATAATYNTSTGAGTATRVDGSNQSFVNFLSTTATLFYYLSVQNTGAAALVVRLNNSGGTVVQTVNAGASFAGYVTGGTAILIAAQNNATSTSFTISSFRALPGNHLSQSSSGQRAIYGVEPVGGRRNLLTYSEQFDNAAWVVAQASNASTTETVSAINNAPLWRVTEDTATNRHEIRQTVGAATIGQSYVLTIYAKNPATNGRRYVQLFTNISNDYANFDLQTGTLTAGTGTITLVETGVYRLTLPLTATSAGTLVYLALANSETMARAGTYTGDGASGLLFTAAQLETGSTATAYQRVVTAFDVTEAGKTSLSYIQFDGSDDGYVSPTITPGIDKAQVFAGVRKLSDGNSIIVETSANSGSTIGSFGILGSNYGGSGAAYASNLNGSQRTSFDATTFAAPITNTLTSLFDIAGASRSDEITFRVNGTTPTLTGGGNSNAGTGNFLAYPLYVGRRAATSAPFNGRIYSLIVRFGANLSAATITQTENWVAGKTGITI